MVYVRYRPQHPHHVKVSPRGPGGKKERKKEKKRKKERKKRKERKKERKEEVSSWILTCRQPPKITSGPKRN